MIRWPNAAVAVALLSILFATSIPQLSSWLSTAAGRGATASQTAARTGSDLSGDVRPALELSSRSLQGTEEDRSPAKASPSAAVATNTPPPAATSPKHIALQAGHWKAKEAPAPLNRQTGTSGGGKTEPEITLSIANETAKILRSWGHTVEILPSVIPSGYKADLFVAIHADGNNSPNPRGFFTDHPVGSQVAAAESRLAAAIDSEYARVTSIPYVNRSTNDSRYYYGYQQVAASVPTVLIETGFLTNVLDQEILIKQPDKAAQGIANGIKRYLSQ